MNLSAEINRKFLLYQLVVVGIVMLLLFNAFALQIVNGEQNFQRKEAIQTTENMIQAPRGLIYDRNGRLLVRNIAEYNLYANSALVNLTEIDEQLDSLEKIFEKDNLVERFRSQAFNQQDELLARRINLIRNVDFEKYLSNFELIDDYSGIEVASEIRREYLYPKEFAHILGYIGQADDDELRQEGKSGIELSMDERLAGETGSSTLLRGIEVSTQTPVAGENLYLSIDLNWQLYLQNILDRVSREREALGSSAVVINTRTGEIHAMVNYPNYDLNLFAEGISSVEFEKLTSRDDTPLLNRAIAMQIPTGSIFKVVMASALQQEGVINRETVYKSGCFELTDDYQLCEADMANYGSLNLPNAIAKSSNPYFCQAAVALASKYGDDDQAIAQLGKYFAEFGLGQTASLEIPGAQPGTMPTPGLKFRLQSEPWYLADLCNTAIGQGLVTATPLQMAKVAGIIVNGGNKISSTILLEQSREQDTESIDNIVDKDLRISVEKKYVEVVEEGMSIAVSDGSAFALRAKPGNPRAKTGSSEATVILDSGKLKEGAHSWVIGAFEYGGEEYAIAVAQQFAGRGFRSVPVFSEFLDCIYSEVECSNGSFDNNITSQ